MSLNNKEIQLVRAHRVRLLRFHTIDTLFHKRDRDLAVCVAGFSMYLSSLNGIAS